MSGHLGTFGHHAGDRPQPTQTMCHQSRIGHPWGPGMKPHKSFMWPRSVTASKLKGDDAAALKWLRAQCLKTRRSRRKFIAMWGKDLFRLMVEEKL